MVPYTIATLDKERKLRIDFRGLHQLKSLAGVDINKLANLSDDTSLDPEIITKILWIALRADDPAITLDQTWELIDNLGDTVPEVLQKSSSLLNEVMKDSFGIKDDGEDNEEEKN